MGYAWINPNNEVFKAFLSAEEEALFNSGINDCTKVEIATSDIEKVFKHASKVVAVHSEDEEILKVRKKLIETYL